MSDTDEGLDAVVIDNGTWMIKAGYAGNKTASAYERTAVGTQVSGGGSSTEVKNIRLFGEKACFNRECKLKFPMHRGSICDWNDMESIWEYIFSHELRYGIEGRPVLITEVPGNNPENRREMVEIMMEKFRVPALYITDPAGLALISSGRLSGIVLDVGGSVTHVTALHQDLAVPSIDALLRDFIHSCEDGVQRELLSNIIISGGTTMTPGVVKRLNTRLKDEFAEYGSCIHVIAPPERRKSSWLGGSIVASLEVFSKLSKAREEYSEKGWAEFMTFPGFEALQTLC